MDMFYANLVKFGSEWLNIKGADISTIHHTNNVPAIRCYTNTVDSIVKAAYIEELLTGVNIDKPHNSILAQHT